MKVLIVGLGIGQLYCTVCSMLNYTIDTVDTDIAKSATFIDVADVTGNYDIAVICTPNFTHESVARTIANKCKIVLIEKPGLQDAKSWACLIEDFPDTRFMMIKNNQYRDDIDVFQMQADKSKSVQIQWNNANRIPQPGSWFTTKNLAFGGVSRDLIPHMLSYYCALTDFTKGKTVESTALQNYVLSDITSTDYGTVNPNGVYDVDDFCKLEFKNGDTNWALIANWKTNLDHDDSSISFNMNNSAVGYKLGLCPEAAYKKMIETAVKNLNNDEFWAEQLTQDLWIHEQIETL